ASALRLLVSGWRVVAMTWSGWTTFASRSALMSVSPSFPAPMTAIFLRASIRPPNRVKTEDRIKCLGTGARPVHRTTAHSAQTEPFPPLLPLWGTPEDALLPIAPLGGDDLSGNCVPCTGYWIRC